VQKQLAPREDVKLVAFVRRALTGAPQNVAELLVHFDDLRSIAVPPASVAFCCLGTTIKAAGSQEKFRQVDFDYVLQFAHCAKRVGVETFVHVSAQGASPSSSIFYSRVKGEVEKALQGVGFTSLVIARPSLLLGDRASIGQPTRTFERLAQNVVAPLAGLLPASIRPITAQKVAQSLVAYGLAAPAGVHIIGSAELHARS
jgi:uncharacterized protein YbjT (DUF2867 family)